MNNFKILLKAALLVILLYASQADAQVILSAQVPPAGIMQQSQLWNVVLTNAGATPATAQIVMRLSDGVTGQAVMTGITRNIVLAQGTTMLHWSDLQPVAMEYLTPVADQRESALLVPGKYVVCYSILVTDSKQGKPGAEDCIRFIVEPVSPPVLNLPADKSSLETPLPQFTWIPPAPVNLFSDLNYDITLVATIANQSAEEAVQQNMPVFHTSGLRQPMVNYPAGAPALDTGVTYAWQVVARNGRQYAAETNVFTFKVLKPAQESEEDLSSFVALTRDGRGKPLQAKELLKCSYMNEAAEKSVKYEIVSLDKRNSVVAGGMLTLQPGANLITVPLRRAGRLTEGGLYIFRFQNARSETWELKFIYQSSHQ